MAKTKNFSDFMAISFVFWANISTGLWDPLGCSDLSQIFFGSSPTGIEWDEIVAEIIITTFVFLGHPRLAVMDNGILRGVLSYTLFTMVTPRYKGNLFAVSVDPFFGLAIHPTHMLYLGYILHQL